MFFLFNFLRKGRKGQIFPLLVAVIVILIIAALITANLGKVSLDRLSCIQAADAGALAGISDFTCGYNKASWAHWSMVPVSAAIQIYLLIPNDISCYGFRSIWALAAGFFNYNMYDWARSVVAGYSSAVRKDAYYYALINAGIDDRYKWDEDEGGYRNKLHLDETWEHWTGLKSAFSKWLNDFPDGWADASSLAYEWQNQSKQVTVSCESSSPQDLRYQPWCLIGLYLVRIYAVCVPVTLPHAPFPFYAWLKNPSTRQVAMTVTRTHQQEERDLGFWKVGQPVTQASAKAKMTGSFGDGTDDFNFKLTE